MLDITVGSLTPADHMKFAVQQAFKYQWLFSLVANQLPEPWLLADTDIIVQAPTFLVTAHSSPPPLTVILEKGTL